MGHNMATWKLLEDMMIELKKKGVNIPPNVIEDLRSAKSMIKLSCMKESHGEVIQKAEEILGTVEAFLITEAQKIFGSETIDKWLIRLEEANIEICEEPEDENKFVVGIPRDQKWIRVEPNGNLSSERLHQLAAQQNLSVSKQNDGRLIIYGSPENIKGYIKKMVAETLKK
jgi:hypothetical protein